MDFEQKEIKVTGMGQAVLLFRHVVVEIVTTQVPIDSIHGELASERSPEDRHSSQSRRFSHHSHQKANAMAVKDEELGSLAQSTRQADLGQTRGILLFIGIATLLLNGFMFLNARKEVTDVGVGPADFDRVLNLVRVIYGAGILLGAFFVTAGILVKKYPVPMTVMSLILYVGSAAGFGMLDPSSLAKGAIIKVIIVVALAKSVQTAWAYQRERDGGAV